jgi:hypothetical protein
MIIHVGIETVTLLLRSLKLASILFQESEVRIAPDHASNVSGDVHTLPTAAYIIQPKRIVDRNETQMMIQDFISLKLRMMNILGFKIIILFLTLYQIRFTMQYLFAIFFF